LANSSKQPHQCEGAHLEGRSKPDVLQLNEGEGNFASKCTASTKLCERNQLNGSSEHPGNLFARTPSDGVQGVASSGGYLAVSPVLSNYRPWCSATSRTSNTRIGGEGSVLPVRKRWGGSSSGLHVAATPSLHVAASLPPTPPVSRLAPSRIVAGFNPEGMGQELVLGCGERVNSKPD
jgi:hypothetical protein